MKDILLALLVCSAMLLFSIVAFSLYLGISPLPISRKAKKKLIAHLPHLNGSPIYELGSGWGGIAFMLAKHYPENLVIAIERSWIPYLFSKVRKKIQRRCNLLLLCDDFHHISLADASLVYCYLFSKAMQRLEPKFAQELPFHAYIISYVFSLPTWQANKVLIIKDLYRSPIFIYRKAFSRA